jgi:apolipoprotein D and lipocalin family protein
MMTRELSALIPILAMTAVLASAASSQTLEVAPSVDLSRYAGKWYEIARLPNRFQNSCAGEVIADYSLLEGDQLKVVNQCRLNSGQTTTAEGEARLADKSGPNSKLKVRFAPAWLSWLPMVWGDYWIIDLAPDYSFSVVGTPDRKYLWILSRTPEMDQAIYQIIVKQTAAKGFDVARLVKTRQSS